MEIPVQNRYIIFPVHSLATYKRLTFKQSGKTVYGLDIKIDYVHPDFYAYIDVARFIGQTVDISVDPQIKLDFRVADEIEVENLYNEPMRPQVHFSVKNGWTNDPNGLIYLDGTYHMFFQHNPAEPNWGNMHWGHATSRDLIHWTEENIALFPDDRGAMFSGSAVLDEKNLLGRNTDSRKAALLYYTTTDPFAQCLSYSVDGFQTIEKYENNPVIPHIEQANRDPKVVFCDELDAYVLALYLKDDIYILFKSDDLVNWSELQRLSLPGDNECPDIFPLCDANGKRKWVLMGAHGRYFVGTFANGKFEPEQEAISHEYGNSAYAAQSFSNLPNGRVVRIAWDRWNLPAHGFNGQMGIPTEMSLSLCENTYYLEAKPVGEIASLYKTTALFDNIRISPEHDFSTRLEDAPYLFKLDGIQIDGGAAEVQIFGRTIRFDFKKNEMTVGNSCAPISVTAAKRDITLIIDRCSIEIYADGGKIYMSCLDNSTLCDRNLPYLVVKADRDMDIASLEMHSLHSIWR